MTCARLADLDPHLHCSVIGTCMSIGELRKLMARFLFVRDASDLEVHHEAVRLAAQGGPVVKALHKALDQRHEPVVQRFARVSDAAELTTLWDEALRHGEIPGAYWAILTHRDVTADLRQKAFGDVHMLSHLVGAANRANIRRLVALERENEKLRERAQRQQTRSQEALEARDRWISGLQQELAAAKSVRAIDSGPVDVLVQMVKQDLDGALALVAVQTERRERAEQQAGVAEEKARRLRAELEHLGRHVQALNRELFVAETQLSESGEGADASSRSLAMQLQGQRVFYVGGRPSSTPSIRDLMTRHGGEFQHHDGGLEDRKGLLAAVTRAKAVGHQGVRRVMPRLTRQRCRVPAFLRRQAGAGRGRRPAARDTSGAGHPVNLIPRGSLDAAPRSTAVAASREPATYFGVNR